MKKLLSGILALVLMLSLTVPALAAGSDTANSTNDRKTIDVTGTYNPGQTGAPIISVDIAWTDMTFTYKGASQSEWNPSTHTYSVTSDAGWEENDNKITVTNHSNVDVNASFAFAKENTVTTNLTGAFSGKSTVGNAAINNGTVTLKAGVVNQKNNADKVEAKLTLIGSLPENWTANSRIGTVTVSIANASN